MVDMVVNGELDKLADLNNLDILSAFYSALIHDFKHPGFNNGFMINSKSEIAFTFNGNLVFSYFRQICFGKLSFSGSI